MTKPLCIYHRNCADGFAAALVVRKALDGDVDFYAADYDTEPPDVTARDVLIVDFSYKLPVLSAMADKANSILVLDHHKTAREDLQVLMPAPNWSIWKTATFDGTLSRNLRLTAVFDMERSGAGIAWDYFFDKKDRPLVVDFVEDRDLWKWKYTESRAIHAALTSYSYDFKAWEPFFEGKHLNHLLAEGEAINRKLQKDVDELLGTVTRTMRLGGHVVPVANLPYMMASEAGNKMATGQPFAATYQDNPDGRIFSLRSAPDGLDVSEIAKAYGGGGHAHAAGFKMPLGWEGEELPSEVATLRADLLKYGSHSAGCEQKTRPFRECTCGFSKAIK